MGVYQLLANTNRSVEDALSSMKSQGAISRYSVNAIPDDHRIEVNVLENVPIKAIQCNIVVSRENTDDV